MYNKYIKQIYSNRVKEKLSRHVMIEYLEQKSLERAIPYNFLYKVLNYVAANDRSLDKYNPLARAKRALKIIDEQLEDA